MSESLLSNIETIAIFGATKSKALPSPALTLIQFLAHLETQNQIDVLGF